MASFWLPVAPRVIIIGSRLCPDEAVDVGISSENIPTDEHGSLLYTVGDHYKVLKHF